MSKFFDDTIKARNTSSPVEAPRVAGVQQFLEATQAVPAPGDDLGSARLAQCTKLRLPRSSDPPILLGDDPLQTAVESYRALRTRLLRLKAMQGVRSVVVSSATQGEGKTLTALNLAFCCAQLQDLRVLLVDGDLRSRGLTKLLGSASSPGLAEVLLGQVKPDEAIQATDLPNLFVLSAGSAIVAPPELYASRRWQELIGWCNESFKLILVDSPPILPLADSELISAGCDGILMVVRALQTRRELLQKAVGQIDSKKLLGVVHNAASNGYQYDYYHYNGAHQQAK